MCSLQTVLRERPRIWQKSGSSHLAVGGPPLGGGSLGCLVPPKHTLFQVKELRQTGDLSGRIRFIAETGRFE